MDLIFLCYNLDKLIRNRETRFVRTKQFNVIVGINFSFLFITRRRLDNVIEKRDHIKKNLRDTEYDVVIVGGGITGAGIALDASNRGMKVALVEMQDFAKVQVHAQLNLYGGLRYLKQLQSRGSAETGKRTCYCL